MRTLANQKHRDPLNNTLRKDYHNDLGLQYKTPLIQKRSKYFRNKICELENTVENSDSKSFSNCFKSLRDTMKGSYTRPISEGKWMSHFQSLH